MNRYTELDGIILKNTRIGEYHKGVRIFSPESGITEATAYGGYKPKSKIGPLVSPLACGHFVLYHTPKAKNPKIEDFSPVHNFLSIQTDLQKYYKVLTWFEIIIRTHGGGSSSAEIFELLIESMKFLDSCTEDQIVLINIEFLLRCMDLLGFPPNIYLQKQNSMVEYKKLESAVLDRIQTVLECRLNSLSRDLDEI
ncbi:MAG: DNA repair protein RecO [Spirochaetia bacterium]|nr:DNA repair protein RecO [Spirochaetia bacterium]